MDGHSHHAQALEPRRLFSSAFANIDISHRAGNEAEGAIAIDPTNPQHLFTFSNTGDESAGLFAATSSDGGQTWSTRILAGPDSDDDLPVACCDPSASFDEFGNLFIAYLNNDDDVIDVSVSTDGGGTFELLATLGSDADQPTITAAEGSVWVTFAEGSRAIAAGAKVNGVGDVGDFSDLFALPGAQRGTFGDIAIGPDGSVAVAYQRRDGKRSLLGVNVDPDGLGPLPFGPRVVAGTSGVKLFDILPAQHERAIDAEVALAYDRSGGTFDGRLYTLYTDVASGSSRDRNNMDLFLRFSDDNGKRWSNALRVNDDTGTASQILPRLALDQTTGQLAVTWLDTRDDQTSDQPDDTDDKKDTDVVLYAAVATPTEKGLTISDSERIAAGSTNAASAENAVELGDYLGLAFHAGTFRPVWSDNSNSTGDNPAGAGADLDLYSASVPASSFAPSGRELLSGFPTGGAPGVLLSPADYPAARKAAPLKLMVLFTDTDALDASTITGDVLHLTGPGAYDQTASLRKLKLSRGSTSATATFLVSGPAGRWSGEDDGVYTITLNDGAVKDQAGNAIAGGDLGNFVVSLG